MGEIRNQRPVLLIAAVASRYPVAIDSWTRDIASNAWGPIALESEMFDFNETHFYTDSMGENLKKKIFAFENLIDPAGIADTKILSNRWELDFARQNDLPESRPLNVDPGYLTEAKLVLATTKDRDHRIYLRDGIFAEVTLHFTQGSWKNSRWTYPDYQRADYQQFFSQCRDYLRHIYVG